MHTDRTTKTLLFAIALGLWVDVAGGWMTPTPAHAAEATTHSTGDVATALALMESQLASVESALSSLESNLSSVPSDISSIESDISSLESDLSSVVSDVSRIQRGTCSNSKIC